MLNVASYIHFDLVKFDMTTEVKFSKAGKKEREGSCNEKSAAKDENGRGRASKC
jgi:hypothetical protein